MSEPIRVGVLGAKGRMGSETCRAVERDDELALAARLGRGDDLGRLLEERVDVAVDFTTPAVVKDNVRFCLTNGIHSVVGTTGLSTTDMDDIREWAGSGEANAFVAPNFAVGAVLMMRFSEQAARFFERAEIVERHHESKRDAPSGTALRTAALIGSWLSGKGDGEGDSMETPGGSRGADASGVRIHSLRVPGSVAHQEVIFGAPGETLTIRHDSLERSSFMPGVLLAVKSVGARPGLTVGLDGLLDL